MLDLGTGRILSEYSGGHINTSYKLEACVSSDDGHLLVCSEDGSLCHYNILTGKMVRKTEYAHSKSLSAVVCHPTDSIVLTSSYDGTAKCWRSDPYTALSTVDS
jgi:WD40 repeat protein